MPFTLVDMEVEWLFKGRDGENRLQQLNGPSGVTVQQPPLLYCDTREADYLHYVMRTVKSCTVSVV